MSVAEVKNLPMNEKFQIMEAIWEEMSEKLVDMQVSPTEQALLDNRLEKMQSGESKVYNWDEVKGLIGRG